MKTRPPLKAVRTFEAAARLLNFKQASMELNVTASAVSHQIRLLEDYLGKALFLRQDRKVSLTAAGEQYFREISRALTIIDEATVSQLEQNDSGILKISAAPVFVSRWLMPRLQRFYSRYPDTELNIHPTSQRVNPEGSDVDLLIRYTSDRQAAKNTTLIELFDVHLTPVCNQSLLAYWQAHGQFPPGTPLMEDLFSDGHRWQNWFDQHPSPGVLESMPVITYDAQTQIFEPAIAGHGIALAMTEMAQEDFAKSVLFRVFPGLEIHSPFRVVAIFNNRNPQQTQIRQFLDWVIDECADPQAPG